MDPSSAVKGILRPGWRGPAEGGSAWDHWRVERTTSAAKVDEDALRELGGSFGGELDRPGEAGYEEHRKVWNGSIDRRRR